MIYKSFKINEYVQIPEMFTAFRCHFKSNFSFDGEYHNFWECVYVINGSICASGDERVYRLNPGDIIFHKPMELHKFHTDSPIGATLFICSFSLSGECCEFLKNQVFCLDDKQKNVINSLFEYLSENTPAHNMNYTDYIKHFYSSPEYSQILCNHLCMLFLMLCQNGNHAPLLTASDAVIFGNVVTFMHNHVSENYSAENIANHFCLSLTSLKRIFAKYAGMGIHKYFMQLKITKATELLKSGLNVTEVAHTLGFEEQSYFSKVYKKYIGMTPSEHVKHMSAI